MLLDNVSDSKKSKHKEKANDKKMMALQKKKELIELIENKQEMDDSNDECSDEENENDMKFIQKKALKKTEEQIFKDRNKIQIAKLSNLQKAYFKNDK